MTRMVDRELDALRETALRMGSLAEALLAKSLRAVWKRDAELARECQTDDLEIDRLDVAVDEQVLKVLALRAPVATDLREVIAIKTMATDLERVGDLARNIAKSAIRLSERTVIDLPAGLEELADDSRRLLRRALDAFARKDGETARAVMAEDDQIDDDQDRVIEEALGEIQNRPEIASQELDLIQIAKNLERVGDHATNIAEDVILMAEARNLKHAEKLAR